MENMLPAQPLENGAKNLEHNLQVLPLLPLKNVVILPKSIVPIIVGRISSIKAVEAAMKQDKLIFITSQKQAKIENPTSEDVYQYGTKAVILQVVKMPNNTLKILVEGLSRARFTSVEHDQPEHEYISIVYQDVGINPLEKTIELEALWRQLQLLYKTYTKLNDQAPEELIANVRTVADIDALTDTIAIHLNLSFDERQALLEIERLEDRMFKVVFLVEKEIDILKTEQRIKGNVQKQVEKNQREYYLSEQMKAIQKELGRDDTQDEINEIRQKVKKLALPKDTADKVEKELRRLEQMPPMSSEAAVAKHYIDWIISLPWHAASKDNISLDAAEKILNNSHAGLIKAKERIIEFLAAKKFAKHSDRAPIICLIGPPGVGKTSLGRTIADSLGREFIRISLGGIRDEAEIRGHRRTYIGALPGKIIQAMRKAGTVNPVILLDEIDKITHDAHGDPSAALLEVLDPEQNKGFVDHFLDTEYDLSKVMFIATANHIDTVPYPLLDRMELITLSGYTDQEKLEIARKFLIPKRLAEYGLTNANFELADQEIQKIISEYTKESGVRQLDRVLTKLMRKVIQQLLKDKKLKTFTVTEKLLQEWLGYPKFKKTTLDPKKDTIGLATGLAWTELGGEILEIEACIVPGKGNLSLTGQLGEVMQESVHAAMSYLRSKHEELSFKRSFTTTNDIHIHIPEGATPKDGPSAGITMCIAILSALTKNPVKLDIAMTGEITLRGRVLGVGGLKEKLLAASRYNMKTVIVPKENYEDILEIKSDLDPALQIYYASSMDEILKLALQRDPFAKNMKPRRKPAVKKTVKTETSTPKASKGKSKSKKLR